MIFYILAAAAATFLAFYLYIYNRYQLFSRQGIDGPKPSFPFGNTKSSILKKRNIVYEIDDIYYEFKDKAPFCGFFQMFTPYLLATDPQLIKQMFIKDFKKFRNNDFTVNHDKDPIIARNPFWMKDDAWKEKRNEVIGATTPNRLRAIYPLILNGTKNLVEYIKREIAVDKMKAFNSRDISARYTCDTICSCTFGNEAHSFTEEKPFFFEKGRELIRGVANSIQSLIPIKMLPGDIEQFFIDIAKEAIRCRKENNIKQDDFLSYTIALKERKGMDDLDAAAHCVTMFLDGYETTSVTMHQALYELGKHKEVQEKLRKEISEHAEGDATLSFEDVMDLPYLNQVFYETLRLHPPLVLTTRVCSEDYEVKGFKGHNLVMKKGSSIWIPIPTIQRDPEHFPNPDAFIPERFNPENGGVKAFKDRCVLIPFGDGPRVCTGMKFAYVQVKSALVEVVRRFEISVDKQTPENLKISPTEFMNVMDHTLMLNFKLL